MGPPNEAARKTITSFREPGIPPRPARIRRRAFFCAAPLLRFVIKVPFMQLLKPINVGQAPNDQTGDTLRDAMGLVNENFAKTRAGVEAAEVATAAAQRKADAAIASAEKGAAGGVTPLDAAGKVPAAHLPPPAIPLSQKSAPGGVAPLDEDGRVPVDHLPVPVASVPLAEKGQPGGVATLAADGKVPFAQLPDLVPAAEKAQPKGVATLAEDGRIVANQLPPLIPAADKGRPGGVAPWTLTVACRRFSWPPCRRKKKADPVALPRWMRRARCRSANFRLSPADRRSARSRGGRCALPFRRARFPLMGRSLPAPRFPILRLW
nr:hypothetical protein [Achromobacter xylosoxidans]